MTRSTTIRSLGTLVQLRSTQVERLEADLASQEATRVRYQNNLQRLTALTHGSGASGAARRPVPVTTKLVASGSSMVTPIARSAVAI